MRKIEAIIEKDELGDLRNALRELGVRTMRVTEVRGEGHFRHVVKPVVGPLIK